MPDERSLLRLMSWLSPAFPVGGFAYSHGLEQAIHDGVIRDRTSLTDWLTQLVERGSGWNDAVLLAEAWRTADVDGGAAVAELAGAMAGSRERHMETTLQGAAFGEAVGAWEGLLKSTPLCPVGHLPLKGGDRPAAMLSPIAKTGEESPLLESVISPLEGEMSGRTEGGGFRATAATEVASMPYPVAIGLAATQHGMALEATLTAYLHAFASNLIQASVRLVPLGQRDGVATLAAIEPVMLVTAGRAAQSTLDDLGSCTLLSDIAAMRHETLYSRVFRS